MLVAEIEYNVNKIVEHPLVNWNTQHEKIVVSYISFVYHIAEYSLYQLKYVMTSEYLTKDNHILKKNHLNFKMEVLL